jgi:hypothetical protein
MCQLMTKFYLLLMGTSDLLWVYTDLRYGFTSFLVAEVGIARFSRVHQLHWLFQTSFTDCSEVVVGNGTDCGVYCCLVESKQ